MKSYRLQLSTNAIHRFSPLNGLRSAVTSEDLKSSLQFKINGQWTATNVHQGLKLSDFLCSAAAELFSSPTSSKNAVRKGLVRLNGLKAQNTDTVSEGDVIESFVRSQQGTFCAELEKKVGEDPSAFERTLVQVLWEDDHCAVVIKPQGMPVFRMKESSSPSSLLSAGTDSDSLPCLQTALPYSLSPVSAELDLQPLRRPQAVHRLDKGTGGLILVAKTRPALVNLTAQFSERTVTKKYRAIVTGRLTDDAAHSAEEPIDSPNLRPREMVSGSISSPLSGQTALTDWSVQPGMHTKSALYGWISTVDLSPHTGRTHQLRRYYLLSIRLDFI